jgi:glycopeptide antibiotics resistance protein
VIYEINIHATTAHIAGAAIIVSPFITYFILTGAPLLFVLLFSTLAAFGLGVAVEVSQKIWGWGYYSVKDMFITALGGPLAWGLAATAVSLI